MVERQLPKLNVVSSSLITRFNLSIKELSFSFKGLVSKTDVITRVSADMECFGEELCQI